MPTVGVTENLYDTGQSIAAFNNITGDWFKTTLGVRQVYHENQEK